MSIKKMNSLSHTFLSMRGYAILFVVISHVSINLILAENGIYNIIDTGQTEYNLWHLPGVWKLYLMEVSRFAVPLFLFLAGFHLVRSPLSWTFIKNSTRKLLLPMVFWSFVGWGISWLHGDSGWSIFVFSVRLITGWAQTGYFFIVLIIQFFFLSKYIIPLVKRRPILVLLISAFIQLLVHIYDYFYMFTKFGLVMELDYFSKIGFFPEWFFPRFCFSFVFGIFVSIKIEKFKIITVKYFVPIILCALISIIAIFLEDSIIFSYSMNNTGKIIQESLSITWGEWKISTAIWTILAILSFSSIFQRRIPFKKLFDFLGKYAYQIFLLHGVMLNVFVLFAHKFLKNIHWYGIIGYIIGVFLVLFLPILFVRIVQKLKLNPFFRTLLIGL